MNKRLPRRPRLKKRSKEENERWRKEYAESLHAVAPGQSSLPPLVRTIQSVAGNGSPSRTQTVFRADPTADAGTNAKREAAVKEASAKAKKIMPLYNKGAYQLITDGDRDALINDGRGKK